ncbi:MAG TPA: hypothetical protein VE326_11165 [Candidatus Binatia bacterium]|nr:hypothetical protein [Candidatus Binatia bacterium]
MSEHRDPDGRRREYCFRFRAEGWRAGLSVVFLFACVFVGAVTIGIGLAEGLLWLLHL